ncbi:MAG: EAL domain-containing protein [Pseudomonadota bacterium]
MSEPAVVTLIALGLVAGGAGFAWWWLRARRRRDSVPSATSRHGRVRRGSDRRIETAGRPTATDARQPESVVADELLDGVHCAILIHREHILFANRRAAALRGMRQSDLCGKSVLSLFAPDDRGGLSDRFSALQDRPPSGVPYTARLLNRTGELDDVVCTDTLVTYRGESAVMTTAQALTRDAIFDASSAANEERAALAMAALAEGVLQTDEQAIVQAANPAALRLLGLGGEDVNTVVGQPWADVIRLIDEVDRQPLTDPVARCLLERQRVHAGRQAVLLDAGGAERPVDLAVVPLFNAERALVGTAAVLHDATETRGLARRMTYEASHDALTGLLNRREFESRLGAALERQSEETAGDVLCYLDLDRFKTVNDTCGHVAGDKLLRQIAKLIREKVRDSDSVARLGGDEFGLLLASCPLSKARQIADDVCNVVEDHQFVWRDQIFSVSVSIGLVQIGPHSGSVEDALSAADSACYVAKQRGRARVHVYSAKDEALARQRGEILWLQRLQKALEDDAFDLAVQPIVAAGGSERGGPACELLLRLRGRDGGLVTPHDFGESAKRYHLMPKIDRWVLTHALTAIEHGRLKLPPGRRCTVNLSGQTMGDPSFLEFVVESLDASSVTGDQLCFEVAESSVIANLEYARRFIDVLHGLNCHFALDDFGSGMGSFANLRQLEMDYIKIDGAYTRDLGDDAVSEAMVAAMVKLARSLNVRVVAEQVESQQTLDAVRDMGIDFVQGHVIGEPSVLSS